MLTLHPKRIGLRKYDMLQLVGKLQRENFQKAVSAGVKATYGTDAGVYPHGWNGKQFFYMVKSMQAIQAATGNGADLFSWSDKIGSISVGKFADIVAVSKTLWKILRLSKMCNL